MLFQKVRLTLKSKIKRLFQKKKCNYKLKKVKVIQYLVSLLVNKMLHANVRNTKKKTNPKSTLVDNVKICVNHTNKCRG